MRSVIQIIKVNEARSGVSKVSGKPYTMQDCECIILDEALRPDQVGVLMLPRELVDKVKPGTYTGEFRLAASLRDRRIEAQVVSLAPFSVPQAQPPKVS